MVSDRKDPDRSSVSKGVAVESAKHGHIETFDPAIARRVARKYDVRLLVLLAAMYLCNALDKTNLGNAKTAGLAKDLGLKGCVLVSPVRLSFCKVAYKSWQNACSSSLYSDQYYNLITAFYAPFCTFGVPVTILIKRFSAARVLPIMALSFGTL